MVSRTIGLALHPTKDITPSLDVLRTWAAHSDSRLIAVSPADNGFAGGADTVPAGIEQVSPEVFAATSDIVVALGGDGTMLGAMRAVTERQVPVLGVNYGNVGFLVEVEPTELESAVERIASGDYSLEPHHGLDVTLTTDDRVTRAMAFNDLAIVRRPGSGVINADLAVKGIDYGFYRADAVVIATPAGSTAYNYAAGGPVLSPDVQATIVTPTAPMSGIDRSVVLGPADDLLFTFGGSGLHAAAELDGSVVADVSSRTTLHIEFRRDAALVVRFDPERHSRKGRIKLSLLDLPVRRDQLLELIPRDVRKRFGRLADPDTSPDTAS